MLSEEVSEEILFAVLGRRWCPPGGGTGPSPDLVAAPGAGRARVLPMSLQFSSLLVTGLTQGDLFISTCPATRMLWWCNPSLVQNKFPPIRLNLALGLKDFS